VTYGYDAACGTSEVSDTRSRKLFAMNLPDVAVAFQAPVSPGNLKSLKKYKFPEFLCERATL
jgi:hypothetical protein